MSNESYFNDLSDSPYNSFPRTAYVDEGISNSQPWNIPVLVTQNSYIIKSNECGMI